MGLDVLDEAGLADRVRPNEQHHWGRIKLRREGGRDREKRGSNDMAGSWKLTEKRAKHDNRCGGRGGAGWGAAGSSRCANEMGFGSRGGHVRACILVPTSLSVSMFEWKMSNFVAASIGRTTLR